QITSPFEAERVGHWCLESEDRDSSGGRQHQLRHGLAWSRCYREDAWPGCGSSERRDEARDELVEVHRLDIHVSRVVLRADSKVGFRGCGKRGNQREQGNGGNQESFHMRLDAPF